MITTVIAEEIVRSESTSNYCLRVTSSDLWRALYILELTWEVKYLLSPKMQFLPLLKPKFYIYRIQNFSVLIVFFPEVPLNESLTSQTQWFVSHQVHMNRHNKVL